MRPPIAPTVQPTRPMDPTRAAAQRAFFEAALGRAQPAPTQVQAPAEPPAPATVAHATAPRAPLGKVPEPGQAAPEKVLRPGSILDIRV